MQKINYENAQIIDPRAFLHRCLCDGFSGSWKQRTRTPKNYFKISDLQDTPETVPDL